MEWRKTSRPRPPPQLHRSDQPGVLALAPDAILPVFPTSQVTARFCRSGLVREWRGEETSRPRPLPQLRRSDQSGVLALAPDVILPVFPTSQVTAGSCGSGLVREWLGEETSRPRPLLQLRRSDQTGGFRPLPRMQSSRFFHPAKYRRGACGSGLVREWRGEETSRPRPLPQFRRSDQTEGFPAPCPGLHPGYPLKRLPG